MRCRLMVSEIAAGSETRVKISAFGKIPQKACNTFSPPRMPTSQWWIRATRRSFSGIVDIHDPIKEKSPLEKGGSAEGAGVVVQTLEDQGKLGYELRCSGGGAFLNSQDNPRAATRPPSLCRRPLLRGNAWESRHFLTASS
jgi:hypothetical protein